MHYVPVALRLAAVLDVKNWRAAISLAKAYWARNKGDNQSALPHFERAMRVDRLRTSEHMALYAILLGHGGRAADSLAVLKRIAAGEFRRATDECRYAEALAHYLVALATRRPDVVERWFDAYKLKPKKGFAARELWLPDNPVDPAELRGKVSILEGR